MGLKKHIIFLSIGFWLWNLPPTQVKDVTIGVQAAHTQQDGLQKFEGAAQLKIINR